MIRIYLDVDDVLNVAAGYLIETVPTSSGPVRVRWLPARTHRLAMMSQRPDVEVVWASSWGEAAQEVLGPLWGIESVGFLPVLDTNADREQAWKAEAVAELQSASPSRFVWIDDLAITDSAVAGKWWQERVEAGEALLFRVQGREGITRAQLDEIEQFLEG